jgi:hypothetical protein
VTVRQASKHELKKLSKPSKHQRTNKSNQQQRTSTSSSSVVSGSCCCLRGLLRLLPTLKPAPAPAAPAPPAAAAAAAASAAAAATPVEVPNLRQRHMQNHKLLLMPLLAVHNCCLAWVMACLGAVKHIFGC